ncbi:hypothetical protein PA10_00304 [Pseudomonas phage pPa_SNUABM_DT01]|nr:hypothetical protein PA10_00304 [Pseudomonas phage pPa_SNUABM_DT01]
MYTNYTIIVDAREIAEAQVNTAEPFKDLFVTRLPSECEEVGYERVNDTLIVKYEENEDGRMMITAQMPYELHDHLPRIFGVIMKLHYGVTKIKLGNKTMRIDVIVNDPTGVYYNEAVLGGKIVRHETAGSVFIRMGDTYSAVSDIALKVIYERFVRRGTGVFIPDHYLVRFVINGRYIYEPMARLFGDAEVAASFNSAIEAADWVEKSNIILKQLGDLTS